jgi:hypothetical protein
MSGYWCDVTEHRAEISQTNSCASMSLVHTPQGRLKILSLAPLLSHFISSHGESCSISTVLIVPYSDDPQIRICSSDSPLRSSPLFPIHTVYLNPDSLVTEVNVLSSYRPCSWHFPSSRDTTGRSNKDLVNSEQVREKGSWVGVLLMWHWDASDTD